MIELVKCQDTEGTQMTTPTSGAACRAIEGCPELNMGNYDEVGVERLNDWAIRANDEIDRLHALAAGQAAAAQAAVPLTDEQIEALPMWKRFVGLWPETRREIVRIIEAQHGIKGGQHGTE